MCEQGTRFPFDTQPATQTLGGPCNRPPSAQHELWGLMAPAQSARGLLLVNGQHLERVDFIPGFVAPDSLTGLLHREFSAGLYRAQAVYPLGTNASCPLPPREGQQKASLCLHVLALQLTGLSK